jgi:uncharacterized membrane protein
MGLLVLAALFWVGLHVGVAGTTLRDRLVARLGEGGFRGAFSLLLVAALLLLVAAWRAAPTAPLWWAPGWLRWLLAALMLPAFVLFVAAATIRSLETGFGEDCLLPPPPQPATTRTNTAAVAPKTRISSSAPSAATS